VFIPCDENYSTAEASVHLTVVQPQRPSLSWSPPADIVFGTELSALQLNAACDDDIEGTFEYSPAAHTILNAGEHELSVKFTPCDLFDYSVNEATVLINVLPRNLKFDLAQSVIVEPGSMLSIELLDIQRYDKIDSSFDCDPPLGTLLEADVQYEVSVTMNHTDSHNYSSTTKHITVKVSSAILPTICWSPPEHITYGTPLSDAQLNAYCAESIECTISYSHPIGTILDAGFHNLEAVLVPSNVHKYLHSTAQVRLIVDQLPVSLHWEEPQSMLVGTPLSSAQLNATCLDEVEGQFFYSHHQGAILDAGFHSLKVQFIPTDSVNYTTAECTVQLIIHQPRQLELLWNTPQTISFGTELSLSQLNAQCEEEIDGVYDYSPPFRSVLPAGEHILSVVFTPYDTFNYSQSRKIVNLSVSRAQTTISWSKPSSIPVGTPLTDSQLNARCNEEVDGTFEYSPPCGTLLPPGEATLTVYFLPSDATNFTSAVATVEIDIIPQLPLQLTWPEPEDLVYGVGLSTAQLNAECNRNDVDGEFEYNYLPGTILSSNVHILSVTFKPANVSQYSQVTASVQLRVLKAPTSLSWSNPPAIQVGTALSATQLCAVCNEGIEGRFEYSPPLHSVLPADPQHELRVVFIPCDENYSTAEASVHLTVVQPQRPSLSWSPPADIVFGTELSALQLNAACDDDIEGSFVYNYPLGTILPAGDNIVLLATFTPLDTLLYAVEVVKVLITVEKKCPSLEWASGPFSINYGTALNSDILNAHCTVNELIEGEIRYSHPLGTILEPGTTAVSATLVPKDSANYHEVTVSNSVEVLPLQIPIKWAHDSSMLVYGSVLDSQLLNANLLCDSEVDGQYVYEPQEGTLLDVGQHDISCSFVPSDSFHYAQSVGHHRIVVTPYPTKLAWEVPNTIPYGVRLSSGQLNAVVVDPQGLEGTYNYHPALEHLLTAGCHELSVSFTPNSGNYMTVEATVEILVEKDPLVIRWSNPAPIIAKPAAVLTSAQLNAIAESQTTSYETLSGTYTYSPPLNSLIDFTSNSTVLGVRFEPEDINNFKGCSCSVVLGFEKPPLVLTSAPQTIEYGVELEESVFLYDSNQLPPGGHFDFADVIGKQLAVGATVVSLRYHSPQLLLYHEYCEVVFPIEVVPAESHITWKEPHDIEFLTVLTDEQLCATCDRSGTFQYSPPLGTILPSGEHTLLTTFIPDEPNNFKSSTASVSVFVSKPETKLKWDINGLIAGDVAQTKIYTAVCEDSKHRIIDGILTYSVLPDYVVVPGEHVFVATFYPTDTENYSTIGKSLIVNVDNIIPKIEWKNPGDVIYLSTLTELQLNAVCVDGCNEVEGVFEYSPSLGTTMETIGPVALSVTFFPNEYDVYDSVSASVTLLVQKATPQMYFDEPEIVAGSMVSISMFQPAFNFLDFEVPGHCRFVFVNNGIVKGTDGNNQEFCVDAGMLEIDIYFHPDDATHFNETKSRVSLTVHRCQLSLAWEPPNNILYGTSLDARLHLNAICTRPGITGLFKYDPSVGAVLTAGNHSLSVEFCPDDDSNFIGAVSCTRITVDKATPAVEWDEISSVVTFSTQITGALLDSFWHPSSIAGWFTYSTDLEALNQPPAHVGEHSIDAWFTPVDQNNFNIVERSVNLKIIPLTPIVRLVEDKFEVEYQSPTSMAALKEAVGFHVSPEVEGSWSVDSPLELDVGSHGVRLLFHPVDTHNYCPADAELQIVVTKTRCEIVWPSLDNITYSTALSAAQLCAYCIGVSSGVALDDGCFDYYPSFGSMLSAGTHTLQATFNPKDKMRVNCAQAAATITVLPLPTQLLWQAPPPLVYGTALSDSQLCAVPSDATVAGVVFYDPFTVGALLPVGSHTITAQFRPADTHNVLPCSATAVVQVIQRTPAVEWPEPAPLTYGAPLSVNQLCARCFDTKGSFQYSCAAGSVLDAGEHLVGATFSPDDLLNYSTVTLHAKITVHKYTPSLTWPASEAIQFGCVLSSQELCARCTDLPAIAGSLNYSPPFGHIPPVGVVTLTVQFVPENPNNYNTVSASTELVVTRATPFIEWNSSEPIQYGQAVTADHLQAIATSCGQAVSGTWTYSHSVGQVLEVGEHSLEAEFTPLDLDKFTPATSSSVLAVRRRIPTLQWRIRHSTIVYKTKVAAEHLNACCVAPKGLAGRFSYSVQEGHLFPPGLHSLTAKFTPADLQRYEAATIKVDLNVLKIRPDLRWVPPKSIDYGRPLSEKQLNAESVNVAGTIVYEPPLGTVLPGGVHVLRATLLPEDPSSFSQGEASVTLTVSRLTPAIVWQAPDSLPFGQPLTELQLNAHTTNPAIRGRFEYSPDVGMHRSLLTVGMQTLACEFIPDEPENFCRASATVQIEITKTKPELLWDKKLRVIRYGTPLNTTEHLNARYADPTITAEFCYDKAVGEVLDTGLRRISLIARPHDKKSYFPDHKVVDVLVERAVPAVDWPAPANIVFGMPLTGQQLNARCPELDRRGRPCEFIYSPPAGTRLRAGLHSLAVRVDAGSNFEPVERQVPLNVERAVPTLLWSCISSLSFGVPLSEAEHLCALALSEGEVVPGHYFYEPPAGSVLSPGSHQVRVTFTPLNSADFTSAEKSVDLLVTPSAPAIVWSDPAAMEFGQRLSETQLNAQLLDPTLQSLFAAEYSPPLGSLLSPGSEALTVVFRPLPLDAACNYTAASKTVVVKVLRIRPQIAWSLPSSIRSDTALSAREHLSARCSHPPGVAGRFDFSCDGVPCGPGTVLLPGEHTLRADFIPDDALHYSPSDMSLPLLVAKRDPQLVWDPLPDQLLFLGVPLNRQPAICNAQCEAGVTGRFFYQIRETSAAGDSCVVQARFTPCEHSARYFNEATLTRTVRVGGSYADWVALSSCEQTAEPFLYSDDRVFTLYPYNDKNYAKEPPYRTRRVKSATGERSSLSPNQHQQLSTRLQSARKLP